jgi:hypothetical protein
MASSTSAGGESRRLRRTGGIMASGLGPCTSSVNGFVLLFRNCFCRAIWGGEYHGVVELRAVIFLPSFFGEK